jgi:hypothetical protein
MCANTAATSIATPINSPASTQRRLATAIRTGWRPHQPAFFFQRCQHGGRTFAAKPKEPSDLRHSDRQRRRAKELVPQREQVGVDSGNRHDHGTLLQLI